MLGGHIIVAPNRQNLEPQCTIGLRSSLRYGAPSVQERFEAFFSNGIAQLLQSYDAPLLKKRSDGGWGHRERGGYICCRPCPAPPEYMHLRAVGCLSCTRLKSIPFSAELRLVGIRLFPLNFRSISHASGQRAQPG